MRGEGGGEKEEQEQGGLVVPEAAFCAPVCKLQGRQTFVLFYIRIRMIIFKSAPNSTQRVNNYKI